MTLGTICAGWVESPSGVVLASAPVLRRWLAGDGASRVARMRRAGFAVVVVSEPASATSEPQSTEHDGEADDDAAGQHVGIVRDRS